MDSIREFFDINRTIVFFVYGLTFFVMGLAVFLQSRRHSRLQLARDLYWLAAFGILHGIHEWGVIFIPIQATYIPSALVEILETFQIFLLVGSFVCLLMFAVATLERRYKWLRPLIISLCIIWVIAFCVSGYQLDSSKEWRVLSTIWARYLLALPASLLAAYGLRNQVQNDVVPLKIGRIYQTLRIAGVALVAYAFFAGMVVQPADFFPANVLNYRVWENTFGVPVQVFRTFIGLILAVTIIRALEIFEIELDRLIEQMEVEHIQAAERERIGQEIHDGAIQGIYSAGLILESMNALVSEQPDIARRLQQAQNVLSAINIDLRRYMVSLRAESPPDPLIPSLQKLLSEPRFHGLIKIELTYTVEPRLKPMQVHHALAIVQEALSNILRHARARTAQIAIYPHEQRICLSISDDGRGFSSQLTPSSYGIRSMRDRARLIGSNLDIQSIPDKGTTVTLTLPEDKSP